VTRDSRVARVNVPSPFTGRSSGSFRSRHSDVLSIRRPGWGNKLSESVDRRLAHFLLFTNHESRVTNHVPTMQISVERPDQPDVLQLIKELDAYQMPLYPLESHHGIDIDALRAPNVLFAVVRDDQKQAIGCGAIVIGPEYAELKRMFIRPEHRGKGIAKALLTFLENQAISKGCTVFTLETGIKQPEALALYAKSGYVRRGPFGSYTHDPNSIFMEKILSSDGSSTERNTR
jgi:putative acetyltransferase